MQQPALYNLQIYNGSYFTRKFVYKINGNPVDLTGYTIRSQIRTSYDGAIILTPTVTIPTPINGEFIMEILATATIGITYGKGVYDIELVPPAGDTKAFRIVQGEVTFSKEVTK